MEKIAAIVEGHTEVHFIEATYAPVRVSRPIPNGRTVALNIIVDAIVDTLEVLDGTISKVIVLLDREGRTMSAEALGAAVLAGIKPRCGNRSIYIGVSDRQIENWIIADEAKMQSSFDPEFRYGGDGCFGKPILQKLNQGVSLGPRDTAMLLKACSPKLAAEKSPSLRRLIESVDFEWTWTAT